MPVLAVTGVAWVALIARSGGSDLAGGCCIPASLQDGFSAPSLGMLIDRNPPGALALGWGLMLVAMMGPMLAMGIRHVFHRSLARRRVRGVLIFLAGYLGLWMAAGAVVLPVALVIRLFAPSSFWPAVVGVGVAAVYQFSPWKQKCLNRGHAHPALAAFGRAADFDVLQFGVSHGVWCVGSCGLLMLATELFPAGHLTAMAVATGWLVAEKLNRPTAPQWRFRGVGKAIRGAFAQTRQALGPRGLEFLNER